MVKIKLRRTVIDSRLGHLDAGRVVVVSAEQARQLIAVGAANEVAELKMLDEKVEQEGTPVPLSTRAMAAALLSSSRQAQAQRVQSSSYSRGGTSSQSTMRGDSTPQQTPSMPATPSGGTSTSRKSGRAIAARAGRRAKTPPSDTD